jgi:uncharacterized protein (TIGR03067 family)
MKACALLLALGLSPADGPAQPDAAPPEAARMEDLTDLQGDWTLSVTRIGGRDFPEEAHEITWTFEAGKVYRRTRHGRALVGTYTLDLYQTPPVVDLHYAGGSVVGRGVYRRGAGLLEWAEAPDDGGRPAGAASEAGSRVTLRTLRRAKK